MVALLLACSSNKSNIDITKPLDTKEATNAQRAYERGLLEKKDQNVMEATRYFEAVRNSFPYSQYAALSELALADMRFDADDYGSAAMAYQEFVKNHPSHGKAGYAAFRVGLAHYQDRASDFFLFPPSSERDQTPIKSALEAFQRFVSAYPKSEYVVRAKDMINDCRERLAAHDRYVAGFYWKRGAWRGAAGRLLELADAYGDLQDGKVRGDSLWRAAVAYYNAKDYAAERGVLTRLVQESPNDPHRKEAESLLKVLPSANAPAPTAPTEQKPVEVPTRPERPESAPRPGEPVGAPAPKPEK
ncbi:MAG: outer membrane protein assembly factor BamD [Myxococcales bacterium]